MAVAEAANSSSGIHIDPMHQFDIHPVFDPDGVVGLLTFTNSALYMWIVVAAIMLFLLLGTRGRAQVPNRVQAAIEMLFELVKNMISSTAGEDGLRYFPYIFTIFTFVLFANLIGMIPFTFTVTSHFSVTAALALAIFVTVTAIAFWKHGLGFFNFFWPRTAPLALRPALCLIELISYFIRPVSHAIRLGANMIAGHAMLKVFAGFVPAMGVFGFLPVAMMVGVTALEFLVAFLQAYVFAILTCIYLNDALHMH